MAAKQAFDHILEQIQSSNLTFQLQLSPFSASISLKKSLIKDKNGNPLFPPPELHQTLAEVPDCDIKPENNQLISENNLLKQEITELESSYKSSQDSIKVYEEKISKIESAALKSFEEKKNEVSALKKSLTNANIENERLNND